MDKVINMNELIGAAAGDQQHMLGKFLYFSLANLLVDKDELSHLCESLGIPYSGSNRLSVSDAFRSATGDIRERIPVTENATKLQAEFQKVGDYDGVNGLQCVDIVRWYIDTYTTLKSTSGNGKDLVERLASNYGLSIDSVPKAPGIFSVAGSHKTWGCSGSAYGHTGIVVSVDTTKVTVKPPCAWTGMRQ